MKGWGERPRSGARLHARPLQPAVRRQVGVKTRQIPPTLRATIPAQEAVLTVKADNCELPVLNERDWRKFNHNVVH
jgi:hypothetical protein